jgi:pimeloyl-ACP methyl ester carboxylesterase
MMPRCRPLEPSPRASLKLLSGVMVTLTITPDMLLARIQAPTLITRASLGTLEPDRGFILTADEAERVQGIIPDSRVVEIPDTNHYTIILSEVFTREVPAFLEVGA